MKRFILTSLAVTAVAVFAAASVDAAPRHGHAPAAIHAHVGPVHVNVAPAHFHTAPLAYGRSVGIPFRAAGYGGWSSRCWFPSYRCYGYYSGQNSLWYYWYAPFNQYLPVTYMNMYPPTQGVPPMGFAPNAGLPTGIVPPAGASMVPGPIVAP